MKTKEIHISDYNYPLPEERIARFPLPQRDSSKLLVYRHGEISEDTFRSLPGYLGTEPGEGLEGTACAAAGNRAAAKENRRLYPGETVPGCHPGTGGSGRTV